jgi:hypothetical protein
VLEAIERDRTESAEVSLHHARLLDALSRALASLDEPYRGTVHRRFLLPPRLRRLNAIARRFTRRFRPYS